VFELHNLHKVGNNKIDATGNFERQGGSVVRLSSELTFHCYTVRKLSWCPERWFTMHLNTCV